MLTPGHLSSQKRSHLARFSWISSSFSVRPKVCWLCWCDYLERWSGCRCVCRVSWCSKLLETNAKNVFFLKLLFKTQILLFIRIWLIISNSSYRRKRGKKRSMTIQTENAEVLPFLWPKKIIFEIDFHLFYWEKKKQNSSDGTRNALLASEPSVWAGPACWSHKARTGSVCSQRCRMTTI